MFKSNLFSFAAAVACVLALAHTTMATPVKVTITHNGPQGGVHLTPLWVGFHNGSFDSYDGNTTASEQLERLAEDGNTGPLSAAFLANQTLATTPPPVTTQTGTRVDGTVAGPNGPIGPGDTAMADFDIDINTHHRYFSYVSMVLPSNDYFVANGIPLAHDLLSLHNAPVGTTVIFEIGKPNSVNDAGTEVNFQNLGTGQTDDSVAGLGLLGPGYVGQSQPNTGTPEGGLIGNVTGSPFPPSVLGNHPTLDFNNPTLYPKGIATVSITVVPEPATALALILGLAGVAMRRRR